LFFAAFFLLLAGAVSGSAALAQEGLAASSVQTDNWQLRRLMQPTSAERAREAHGEIVIYDGLTDAQVEAAMSAHPERIRNMMFVGTIVTDQGGQPLMDDAGMFVLQDDGC
jgi:mevalonate pyrophosphate decarboxylase